MKTGIISLYYSFLGTLYHQRQKLGLLQLTGRLEDFIVKEFIYHIWHQSEGKRFALTNVGNKGEQKFDIAVLSGHLSEAHIVGLVEAKYLRNWHRAWPYLATDETRTSLNSLAHQLGSFRSKWQGNFPVELSSRSRDIYGLVIASFVCDRLDDNAKEQFFRDQLTNSAARRFRYHDLYRPYFRKVYDDVSVRALRERRFTSLRIGLWKLLR